MIYGVWQNYVGTANGPITDYAIQFKRYEFAGGVSLSWYELSASGFVTGLKDSVVSARGLRWYTPNSPGNLNLIEQKGWSFDNLYGAPTGGQLGVWYTKATRELTVEYTDGDLSNWLAGVTSIKYMHTCPVAEDI
jgi:hypothetical protein